MSLVSAFDPSQFKLQADGTFRISIRGMASMAGIAVSGLSTSLKTAVHEKPLPVAKSLLAQGFCPVHVSGWGETGGIPEDAAPFILEHYGIESRNPSQQARAALLAFSRVGINAYLREKLGLTQPVKKESGSGVSKSLSEIRQACNLLRDISDLADPGRSVLENAVIRLFKQQEDMVTLESSPTGYQVTVTEAWRNVTGRKLAQNESSSIGRKIANTWRKEFGTEPPTAKTVVDGVARDVCRYDQKWLESKIRSMGQGSRIVGIVKKGAA